MEVWLRRSDLNHLEKQKHCSPFVTPPLCWQICLPSLKNHATTMLLFVPEGPWVFLSVSVSDKWAGADWMSGAGDTHTHTTRTSDCTGLNICWEGGQKKHLFTSRKYWLLPLSEMGYWCLYPADDVSENRYGVTGRDTRQMDWGTTIKQKNVSLKLQKDRPGNWGAGLKLRDISIYVSTTKTFISA